MAFLTFGPRCESARATLLRLLCFVVAKQQSIASAVLAITPVVLLAWLSGYIYGLPLSLFPSGTVTASEFRSATGELVSTVALAYAIACVTFMALNVKSGLAWCIALVCRPLIRLLLEKETKNGNPATILRQVS